MPKELIHKTYIKFKFDKAKITMDIKKLKILKNWKFS